MDLKRSPFFAPAPLAAVAVLALNDHWLKARFHNALTGKLTDLALCFFFPLLLSVALRPLWAHDRRRLAFSALFTAALFTLLELWAPAGAGLTAAVAVVGRPLGFGLTPFTRDLTDLLALAVLPLAWWYGVRRLEGPPAPRSTSWLLRLPALGATLVLLVAESPVEDPDCDQRSAPVTFRVTGECGAPGIIVVHGRGFDSALTADNAGAVLGASEEGRYQGGLCPFRLDLGDWSLENRSCPDAGRAGATSTDAGGTDGGFDAGELDGGLDGGADAGTRVFVPDAGAGFCSGRRCSVRQENGGLWITCEGMGGSCKAQLTVLEGP